MRLQLELKYILLVEFSQIMSRWSAGRWAAKHSSALRLKPCDVRLNYSLTWQLVASGVL
jgi:hypothetical protein